MLARTRLSGEWSEDDYDVLADGIAVGRIFRAAASPEGSRWMWPLAFGHHGDRTPTHGYAATREAAMAEFAKSWRRGHGLAVSSPQAVIRSIHSTCRSTLSH
jgi:hypothetical protein